MLRIDRQRHDHIPVSIVGSTDSRTLGIRQLHLDGRCRIQDTEEITDKPRVEFDPNGLPVVLNGQLDATFTTFGRTA